MRHFLQQILNISALVAIASAQLIIPQVVLDQTPGLEEQQQQRQVMAEDDTPMSSFVGNRTSVSKGRIAD
jgi:hypothetical protein